MAPMRFNRANVAAAALWTRRTELVRLQAKLRIRVVYGRAAILQRVIGGRAGQLAEPENHR